MRYLLLFTLFLSSFSLAEVDFKEVYLSFEEAYMSNDVNEFEPWLHKKYKISQTLHIPGVGADTRPVTKNQLLQVMKSSNTPNTMPRSTLENTNIEIKSKKEFCGISETINKTNVSGKTYEEKEVHKVCFKSKKGKYLAVKHNIDVYYKEL